MKQCPKCGNPFDTSSSRCPPCHNEYQKAYYKRKPYSIQETGKLRKKRNRDLIIAAKSVPCKDCGKQYPYYCMDFDHLSNKRFNLSVGARYSEEVILAEIAKCEVVCAVCHRERTFSRSEVV